MDVRLRAGASFDVQRNAMIVHTLLPVHSSHLTILCACVCLYWLQLTSHICYARDHNIELMTFDNADELYKVRAHARARTHTCSQTHM